MSTLHFSTLGSVFKYGYLGIYLFFILSGYTIVLSAINKSFTKFIYARLLRLYPSFWVAVCLTTLASLFLGGSRYHVEPLQFLANLTMLNEFVGIKSVDGAYWFLSAVLRFYFLIAVLILFDLVKFQKYIVGIWLATSLVIYFYPIKIVGVLLIPQYAPFLISGMIFYLAKKEGWDLYKSFIIITSLSFSLYQIVEDIPTFNKHYSTNLSLLVVLTIVSSIYVFMFYISLRRSRVNLSSSFVTLGACAYPLYLIHQNIGFMLFNKYGQVVNKHIILMSAFFLMFSFSFIILKYIDPNIVNVMKKLIQIPTSPASRLT
jgi:peptidoglycan/LPS O-acetylase OafA/YrhL